MMHHVDIIKTNKLEVITTPDGELFPVYRDWDEWHNGYVPKMAYISIMRPETKKGVILHKKRTAYITAISGNIILEYANNKTLIQTILSDEIKNDHWIIKIPPNVPIMLYNKSINSQAIILNLPSPAWHPDDQDTYKFNDWASYFESEKNNESIG